METLKNLLTPGKDRDNEQIYGTGENTNTARSGNKHGGRVSGEGSHLARSTGGSHSMPGQYPSDSTTDLTSDINPNTSNVPHSSNVGSKIEPRADASNSRPIGEAGVDPSLHSAGFPNMGSLINAGHSSSLGNQAEHHFEPGMSGSETMGNQSTSHTGTGPRSFPLVPKTESSTAAGPPSSNLDSKLDPRVHSDMDASRNLGSQDSTAHPMMDRSYPIQRGFEGSASNTTSASHTHGSDTAALGAAGTSHHHQDQGHLGSNTISSTHTGLHGTSGDSHHHSHQDPSVPNTTSSTHNHGSDTSALATAAAATALTTSHDPNEGHLGSNTTHPATHSGLHGTSGASHHHVDQGHLGSNTHSSTHTGLHGASGASHHHPTEAHLGSNTSSSAHTGLHGISGPHQTETANRLDPHVAGGSSRENAIHHHGHSEHERKPVGGGAEEADSSHKDIGITSADATKVRDTNLAPNPELTGHHGSTSHTGRDASLGAGAGLGAAGLAKHEHSSHHTGHSDIGGGSGVAHSGLMPGQTSGIGSTSGNYSSNTGIARGVHTAGNTSHHDRNILGGSGIAKHEHDSHHAGQQTGQFGVGNTHGTTHQSGSAHPARDSHTHGDSSHHTRDAAVGAGAGVGAASLAKHEHDKHQADRTTQVGNAFPTTDSDHAFRKNTDSASTSTSHSTPRHGHPADYGRDAVLGTGAAAGVGSAAYEAERLQKEKELEKQRKHQAKEHEKELKKENKREEKHAHDHEKKEEKKHRGLFSFLHRDKSKKYSAEEEKEFDRQEREHKASQPKHGYEAAGAGALGVGAAGLVEEHKHHGQHSGQHAGQHPNTTKTTHAANDGAGTLGVGSALGGLPGQSNLGADTVGVFGAANKTSDTHSSTTTQHSGTQHSGHHGTSTTGSGAGTSALEEHDHSKHYTTSGKHAGDHSTGHHQSSANQPRLSEADFDQHGNPIGSHKIPSVYGTETGHDGRNRLHKDPPADHPAAQAMGEHSSHGHGHRHSSTHDTPGKHEDLTGAVDNLAGNTGVKNAGGNTY